MTIYGIIILTALLFSFVLETGAGLLNIQAMREHPPEEFADIVDAATWSQTRAYAKDRATLEITSGAFKLITLLTWWFAGGFPWLDRIVNSWHLGDLAIGVLYIGLLLLISKLVSLPFKIYGTFVVEARYGFNKTTLATFITDKAKGVLLSLVLGGPFLIALLYFFQYTGSLAWLYCWGLASAFLLFIQYIAPILLMPLFNRYTPLPDGMLRQAIQSHAQKNQFPISNLFVMDGSRRTTKTNAFVTGFGRHRRIALFDTMIERHSISEVVAVLAHEIGHAQLGHIPKMTTLALMYLGVLCGLLAFSMQHPNLHHAFYMERVTLHGGLTFFTLLVVPLDLLMGPILKWISRHYEYAADRHAATSLPDPMALVSALKKLAVNNLANLTPHPLQVIINHSHPPLLQRIEAIKQCKKGHNG